MSAARSLDDSRMTIVQTVSNPSIEMTAAEVGQVPGCPCFDDAG
jgi:hypothetical protein